MTFLKVNGVSVLLLALLACNAPEEAPRTIVNVLDVAAKSKADVMVILGKAESCEPNEFGERCFYQDSRVRIVYTDGKAARLEIHALKDIDFKPLSITALGLEAAKPTFMNNFVLRWERIQGLREVSIFPEGTKIHYAYVTVF